MTKNYLNNLFSSCNSRSQHLKESQFHRDIVSAHKYEAIYTAKLW